jgi:hypothetical protein
LRLLVAKWQGRKKYTIFVELPDFLVAFFALFGFLVTGFYGYILGKVVRDYLETANKVPLG